MKRRTPVPHVIVWAALRSAIRITDWARNAGPIVILSLVLLSAGAIWLASPTSAHFWVSKSWFRLFGGPQSLQAGGALGMPQSQDVESVSGYTLTTFDATGAGTVPASGTVSVHIDAAGDVVGDYVDNNNASHGFLRTANGTITNFDAPHAGSSTTEGTFVIGMDPGGNYIAGTYVDSGNGSHGFVRASDGVITEFDVGDSGPHRGTIPFTVNTSGTVAGTSTSSQWNPEAGLPYYRGFVRDADGTVTLFDAPGAGLSASQGTIPISINNSGILTGLYINSSGVYEGFVRAANGTITEFQVPCQTTGTNCYATVPTSIDTAGDIVGAYGITNSVGHGFVRAADGTITTFDPTGSVAGSGIVSGTLPLSIDPGGNYVTGFYTDANGIRHGFVRTAGGTITSFDAPGAATSKVLVLSGTGGSGVNASGEITGGYVDSKAVFHGLLLTPSTLPQAATPTFSPKAGTYNATQSVTISDMTPGATIYYTTDGSTPTTNSFEYGGAIAVNETETIKAIAVAADYNNSAVASATYTLQALSPVFTPGTGTYTGPQSVTITDATSGATIYYAINATPTTSSTKYTGAITVSSAETIEAIAVVSGYTNSAVTSATYTITSTSGLQFIPVTPCRIVDTRWPTGPFGGPEMAAGTSRSFNIPQSTCGIPSTAVAYSLNVTVVPDGFLSYLTLWPTGETQPYVSTLNSDGRVKANAAITPAGTNEAVSVFVSNATNVILDIDGYFVPAGTASALAFYSVTPCRVADTRQATGPLGGPTISGGSSRSFPVQSSSCGIPATAKAYSLNVTAVPHTTLGYLTAWATGQTQPYVSTLNSSTGAVTANAAVVPAGTSGAVSIFVSDTTDVILDVNGYFAPPATGGLSLYPVTPCRIIDTRSGAGAFNGVLAVDVETSSCAPPSSAQGYVLNATVVPPGSLDYLTLWPAGEAQPYVSTLNALDGAITSNMAIVPTTNGSIDAFSSNPTNLILDLSGYFAP